MKNLLLVDEFFQHNYLCLITSEMVFLNHHTWYPSIFAEKKKKMCWNRVVCYNYQVILLRVLNHYLEHSWILSTSANITEKERYGDDISFPAAMGIP